MAAASVIIIAALLIVLASRYNSSGYEASQQPTPSTYFESQHWEKNHFINKHLHRDDEKHARHKCNQTPW